MINPKRAVLVNSTTNSTINYDHREKLAQWKESLSSTDATEVINTMLTISNEGGADTISFLRQAGSRMHPLAKTLPIPTPIGELDFDNFKTYCINLLRQRLTDTS
jgi:hypothetical protein